MKNYKLSQSEKEIESLIKYVKISNELVGDFIEVGVYEGGSANIIAENKLKTKKLYLIDTFAGLKDVDSDKDRYLQDGQFEYTDIESLIKWFENKECIVFKGFFPKEKPQQLDTSQFCFVHLDVDTYHSTLNSLMYLFDKISDNGVILVHDYVNSEAPGVKKAVDEFLEHKKLEIYEIVNSQCVIIKSS